MGPTWGPPGSCRPQVGPMSAPWTLLSGTYQCSDNTCCVLRCSLFVSFDGLSVRQNYMHCTLYFVHRLGERGSLFCCLDVALIYKSPRQIPDSQIDLFVLLTYRVHSNRSTSAELDTEKSPYCSTNFIAKIIPSSKTDKLLYKSTQNVVWMYSITSDANWYTDKLHLMLIVDYFSC